MANIDIELAQIAFATYGEEVRDAIVSALRKVNNGGSGDLSNYYTKTEINSFLNGLKFIALTQAEYDEIENPDENTLYIIVGDDE